MIDRSQTLRESQQVRAAATALVVDRDATSRRFCELALGRAGFAVEAAQDAGGALEMLKVDVVDLIVCDTELDDMDGLTLFRRLTDEQRLRSIPFMFLSADPAPGAKVSALKAGVSDYLVKPCDVTEFVARAESLVRKQRQVRAAMSSRSFGLAGELSVIAFADVIALLEMSRRNGVLSLFTPNLTGRLLFEHGRVIHAQCQNLIGPEAFFRLFREPVGHFEFAQDEPGVHDLRTIHESATALVLEAARLTDLEGGPRPRAPIPTIVRAKPPPVAPAKDPAFAFALERALEDRFTLGDLSLWSEEALAEWTAGDQAKERFHVHLIADLASGVSSLLPLAAAPSERLVMESLSRSPKCFGITFRLRRDRMLDLLLIDAVDPIAHLASLHRVPSLMLVCPPDGNLLALGSSARVGLEHLIETLAPPVVIAVGSRDLPGAMGRTSAQVSCIEGDLSSGRDLRALLIEGLRTWVDTV